MANIVNARDKNNNIVYPITKTSLVLDNNGTSVDILLAGKQDSLTSAQMTATNSGITSALVTQIGTNTTNITSLQNNKQDNLTTAQLNAVNSGITANKVAEFESKQDALSQTQLNAVNSGVTSTKIGSYDENLAIVRSLSEQVQTLDTTVYGLRQNKADKSYVDGLTTPSSWTTATASNVILGGTCKYVTIGKLVIVHMEDVTIASGTADQGALLFSGLPNASQGFITIMLGSSPSTQPVRFFVSNTGNMTTHYSDTGSFGNTGGHHYADFCYIKA